MNDFNKSHSSEGSSTRANRLVTNHEVKIIVMNYFGSKIKFSTPKQLNKSMMFYNKDFTDKMVESTLCFDPIEQAASILRKALIDVEFDLNDRFCDANDLEESLNNTKIPEPILRFFATLFNFDQKKFYADRRTGETNPENMNTFENCDISDDKRRKMSSLFQIMFYIMHNGCKRTPLHVMNSEAIYDACKSATLITSFNHFGLCLSYDELMRFQNDMATFTVKSCDEAVPFPNHFDRSMFTTAAFDNFDHEEATLSGIGGSHDTVSVLFQDDGGLQERKPRVSETNVQHGPRVFNSQLKCQNLQIFHKPSRKADLPASYSVSASHIDEYDLMRYYREIDIAWLLGRVDLSKTGSETAFVKPSKQCMPIWSASNAILFEDKVPLKRIGFLPVLPSPVTQYDTVYTSLKNLQNILQQIEQPSLSVTCDEGVYRVAREIQ